MAASGSAKFLSDFTQSKSAGLIASQTLPGKIDSSVTVTSDGTGADQANKVYSKQLSLAGTTLDLDLTALTDVFGDAFVATSLCELHIQNLSTSFPLTIGSTSTVANFHTAFLSNPGTITLPRSTATNISQIMVACFAATAFPVDSSHKLVRLDPGANSFTVNVVAVCRA